jgi:hypothetical protein
MSRKVKRLRLQTNIHISGAVGELGNVIPPNGKTLENLTMVSTSEGVELSFNFQGAKTEALVPYGNIALAEYVVEKVK